MYATAALINTFHRYDAMMARVRTQECVETYVLCRRTKICMHSHGRKHSADDGCAPPKKDAAGAAGKSILATRGECTFIDKAEAMDAGAGRRIGALIVTNSETALFHMGAAPR